jgi:membrane peptidoglycan carboxypeptidase
MARTLGVTSPRLDAVGAGDGSLTLGAFEVTPMDMATAYATLAAHGKRCWPKPLLEIREQNHRSSYTGPGGCQQVLDPAVADTVSSVLQGVIREGTAAQYGSIGRPAAGKTGTTEDNQSAWFVGYVPQLAAAVWVGDYRNPVNFPLRYSSTTPEGVPVPGWYQGTVFGGGLPTELWARAMRAATADLPVEPFPVPAQIVGSETPVAAPPVASTSTGGRSSSAATGSGSRSGSGSTLSEPTAAPRRRQRTPVSTPSPSAAAPSPSAAPSAKPSTPTTQAPSASPKPRPTASAPTSRPTRQPTSPGRGRGGGRRGRG